MNMYGYEISFSLSPAQEAKKRAEWAYKQCKAFERQINATLRNERKQEKGDRASEMERKRS